MSSPRPRSRHLPLVCSVLCAGFLLGCHAPPEDPLPFRLGLLELPSSLLIYIAQDADLFTQEKLQLQPVAFASGREALQGALSGSVDAAVVYATPVVVTALGGEDVVVLSLLHRADGLTGVAVRPGARIQTAAQLRGHKVGVTPGTSSQLALDVLLAEGGLSASDVEVVPGSQTQLQELLNRGEVDAASLWVPNLFTATRPDRGNANLVVSEIYSELSMLAGLRKHVEAHHTEVLRLLRALDRAQGLLRDDPNLALATLRRRFPQLSDDNLRVIAGRSRFELGLSNLLLSSLRQEAAWLEERGVTRHSRVRLRDVPLLGPLDEVSPEAITLLTLHEEGSR